MEQLLPHEEKRIEEDIVKIIVVGVGGGGCNAVEHMIRSKIKGVHFYAANTDAQALHSFKEEQRINIGRKLTKGLGAGSDPEIGRKAAEESYDEIKAKLKGAGMVFIASGMGGGTGTGAAPIFAQAAKEVGALCVAIVTTPFDFEGSKRRNYASEGILTLRNHVDSLIVVSNETLLQMFAQTALKQAFQHADDILCQSVRAVTSLITEKALINLDFADIRNVMKDKGTAMIGMGKGLGEQKARDAANQAISSPLLGSTIKGAKNAIVNITCGEGMTLLNAHEAVEIIREAAGDSVNIIFGVTIDDGHLELSEQDKDFMYITVIATDFANSTPHRYNEAEVTQPFTLKNFEEKKEPTPRIEEEKEDPDLDFVIPSFLKRK